uniref:RanBD1 domain-containing protein n=1 Tax=Phlebotomus papatasi TaxID=29031 RepID=A0A1B0DDN2_PHLPP
MASRSVRNCDSKADSITFEEMSVIKHKDKSYSWTATDLVQGILRLVKFYVRFKTTESSTEFKAIFEKIKAEMKVKDAPLPTADSQKNAPPKAVSFSFTGFPTNPQIPTTASAGLGKKADDGDKKVLPNPFSGFTFGKPKEGGETEKTFSNLFTGFNTSGSEKVPSVLNDSHGDTSLNRSTGDGEEDEYVSTAQFQPVIPLPKLVDVKTGEENETVLFEHRAKLLRFDKETKEWKERGIGNMKVLVNKDDSSKVRLLMRREQVLKLCCNQLITEDLKFTKMQGLDTALTWYGQDYSENEVKVEMLAIRFKTADICSDFHNAVLKAQANIKSPGEQKKPEEPTSAAKTGFGDAFKKKDGQWECQGCCVVNAANVTECVACKGPKDPTAAKKEPSKGPLDFSANGKFSFGMPPSNSTPPKPTADPPSGFGDKFKPKAGSWECKACLISNQADALYCVACDNPKDDTVPKKNQSLNLTTQTKFTFGMPATTITPAATVAATTTASDAPTATFSFGFKPPAATGIFTNVPSFGFNSPQSTTTNQEIVQKTPEKPDLSLQGKETFNFKFTPKSPGKIKSPTKTTPGKDGSDEEGEVEEENNTYFTP